jgi:type II secretory ATPase GspE/PulE/Tfp pilus assembly ATPase PilB-like protein
MAQRLLRRTCQTCRGTGSHEDRVCETCGGNCYKGRVGVYEIMKMNDELRTLTLKNADAGALFDAARRDGFKMMKDDAAEKVALGLTDQAEVFRVLH